MVFLILQCFLPRCTMPYRMVLRCTEMCMCFKCEGLQAGPRLSSKERAFITIMRRHAVFWSHNTLKNSPATCESSRTSTISSFALGFYTGLLGSGLPKAAFPFWNSKRPSRKDENEKYVEMIRLGKDPKKTYVKNFRFQTLLKKT